MKTNLKTIKAFVIAIALVLSPIANAIENHDNSNNRTENTYERYMEHFRTLRRKHKPDQCIRDFGYVGRRHVAMRLECFKVNGNGFVVEHITEHKTTAQFTIVF